MIAVPRMIFAPRVSASLSIIASNSLRRTCQVVDVGEIPILIARRDLHIPAVGRVGAVDPHAVLYRVGHRIHLLRQPEPSQHLGGFTGERFADVEARKFLLLEDDRRDPFSQ